MNRAKRAEFQLINIEGMWETKSLLSHISGCCQQEPLIDAKTGCDETQDVCNFKVPPHKRKVLITKELLYYERKNTFINNYKGKNSNFKVEKPGRYHLNQ